MCEDGPAPSESAFLSFWLQEDPYPISRISAGTNLAACLRFFPLRKSLDVLNLRTSIG